MNYKNFIKSRSIRTKILSILSFIPDKTMISVQYKIHTGRKIRWNAPIRFTEKIQMYKLSRANKTMLRCTDKFEVREYVAKKELKELLIP